MTTPVPPQAPTPALWPTFPVCQAFTTYDAKTKKHLQCGAASAFILRRREPVEPTEDWRGEPFYLCAAHADMAARLVPA